MKFFITHLRATRNGLLVMLAVQGGLFLMGVIMVVCINVFLNEDQDYAAIGSMMALMGTIFGGLLRGSGATCRYRMAVSMGHTRRSYLLADPLITAINCLLGFGAAWLLNRLELWFYGLLYPGWSCEFDISGVYKWWAVLLFTVLICAADFCLGAIQLRFGAKGFALVWFPLCFGPCILTTGLKAAKDGGSSLLAMIGRGVLYLAGLMSPAMLIAAGAALVLALVLASGLFYRKAEVRI